MGVRVLLAEDEALIALSLADLLEAEGHDVVLAPDGAEALDAARRLGDALGALVTDLNMPRMGGEDLIRAVRAERPGLPVVVVTGSAPFGGAEELRRHAGGHGPLLLLLKPPTTRNWPRRCGGWSRRAPPRREPPTPHRHRTPYPAWSLPISGERRRPEQANASGKKAALRSPTSVCKCGRLGGRLVGRCLRERDDDGRSRPCVPRRVPVQLPRQHAG